MFADDLGLLLKYDQQAWEEVVYELSQFQSQSGMLINYDKTEIYRMGSIRNTNAKFYANKKLQWTNDPVKVLGVYVTPNQKRLIDLNIEPIIKRIKSTLSLWKQRNLFLRGKIQIVNALIGSLFVYKMSVLPNIGENHHKAIDELISSFIWNEKKSKIPLNILKGLYEQGGAGLVNLRAREQALKAQWVWTVCDNPKIKALFDYYINNQLGEQIFQIQLKDAHIKEIFPSDNFWSQVMCAWCLINYEEPIGKNEVLHETLWYNSNILIGTKPVFYQQWLSAGVLQIKHIINQETGNWFSHQEFQDKFAIQVPFTKYQGIIQSIPTKWKRYIKEDANDSPRQKRFEAWKDISNKTNCAYRFICKNDKLVQSKWIKVYYDFNQMVDYDEYVISLVRIRQITISEKLRSFHYRFLLNAIVTNIQLKHYGIREDNKCSNCNSSPETVKHLFFDCEKVQPIWDFYNTKFKLMITYKEVFLNNPTPNPKHVENCVMLIIKQHIYVSRCLNQRLSLESTISMIDNYKMIEEQIAKSKGKSEHHENKWEMY